MLEGVTHPVYGIIDSCGFPIKMSQSVLKVDTGCPELGQDTGTVLKELLSYSDAKISELRKGGVIS
jgi:crotonobetainyl-CoA:carnitine CoA-transferase CaiB-like acyl-CoA transferase